jgi:hypothetical protein
MSRKIHRIDKILQKTFRTLDLEAKLDGYRIWPLWHEMVGEQIARRAQPERIRNRVLFIRVASSTWMQQLQTMKPVLLEKIHKITRQSSIEDIRFSLGEVTAPSPTAVEPLAAKQAEVMLKPEMEDQIGSVQDAELRELIRNIMMKQAQRIPEKQE